MSSVESGKLLGVVARARERVSRSAKERLFPLTAFREFIPLTLGKENFSLLIYDILKEKGHPVEFRETGSDDETIEVWVNEETYQLKEQIFSSPESAVLQLATDFGVPKKVEVHLEKISLSPEVKKKIMQLARKRDIERRRSGFQKKLDELKTFLDEEFEEEISNQINTVRVKGERKLEEKKNKVLSSETKPLTSDEAREILVKVYERLVGRE